jgi:hypothetical protein
VKATRVSRLAAVVIEERTMVQLETILEVDVASTDGLIDKVSTFQSGKGDSDCLEESAKGCELSEPECELDVAPCRMDTIANESRNAPHTDVPSSKAASRRRRSLIDKAAKLRASAQEPHLVPAHISMAELTVDWSNLVQRPTHGQSAETIATIGVRDAAEIPKKGLKHNRKKSLIDKAALQLQRESASNRVEAKTDSGSRTCPRIVEDVRQPVSKRFCSLCEGTKFCVLCNGAS